LLCAGAGSDLVFLSYFGVRGREDVAVSKLNAWTRTVSNPDLEIIEIAEPVLEPARVLFAYYAGLEKDGALPNRRAIDPLEIPREVLSSVYILEPAEDYQDWIYRLIGTEIVDRFQVDRTGQSLRSFLPRDRADALVRRSRRVVDAGAPAFFKLLPRGTAMEHFYAETMSLPVHDQKSGRVWLFGGTFFVNAES
jgi:hypothetical protein